MLLDILIFMGAGMFSVESFNGIFWFSHKVEVKQNLKLLFEHDILQILNYVVHLKLIYGFMSIIPKEKKKMTSDNINMLTVNHYQPILYIFN